MSDLIITERIGHVTRLTLNSPASLNALSDAMLAALTSALGALADDRATRVIILRGTGKAFCAGHDLKEMQAARQTLDKGAAYFLDLFTRCGAMMQMIPALPQPVIAEVHGIATAAGCQLVASCDMAVAAEGTRFGVNGVNIGLFCSTPMVALSRNVPRKAAFEMLTTGEFIDAARARELGLVNRVVPAAELFGATLALAQVVAGKLTTAVKIGKRAFYEQIEMPQEAAYQFARSVMERNALADVAQEQMRAFLEKRGVR